MKTVFVRSMLSLALPFILVGAFVSTLVREIRNAFWYAWQEVRIEAASFSRLWNDAGGLS